MVKGFDKADPDISDLYFGRDADGVIIDGKDWVPPADFDSRTRSWYKDALAKNGLFFGEPYLDGVTKKMALPIGMNSINIQSFSGIPYKICKFFGS